MAKQKTQTVNVVHQFGLHIACAAPSQSELIIPVFGNWNKLLVVLDIDINQPGFLSQALSAQFETLFAKLFSRDEQV